MFVLLVAAVAALAAADPLPYGQQDGRIVGGREVLIENFPYQVSLNRKDEFFCGGSIISRNFVLTAAHCVYNKVHYMSLLNVRAGSNVTHSGGTAHRIKRIVVNSFYRKNETVLGDAAVVEIRPPFRFDATRQPVKLVDESFEVKSGALTTTSGFGVLHHDGPESDALRAVSLPIVPWDRCYEVYEGLGGKKVTKDAFCAGFEAGERDACQGDSGGPVVYKGRQIGIVSWGRGCGKPGIPGVYQSVAATRKFIREHANV